MRLNSHYLFALNILLSVALLVASDDGGNGARFERIGPYGGDVRSLLMDPQQPAILYLGTSNGKIFKSQDAGASWSPLYPGIGKYQYVIDTLVLHPTERDHIYAGAWDLHSEGGGLFESRDAGATWTRVALPNPISAIRGFEICRTKPAYMIVGTLAGAFVSSDAGSTWVQVGGNELEKAESVAIDPVNPKFLYVGTWRLSYRSVNFGKTWVRVEKGMALDSDVFSIAVGAKDPSIIYSSACSGVYRSTDQAQSWSRLRIVPERFSIRAHLVYPDPVDPHRIYTGTTEGLFVSNNDGKVWKRLTPADVVVNAIQVNPANNQQIMIGTEYQGVLISEDSGKKWKESNVGFVHKQIPWFTPDPAVAGNLVAGVHSGSGGFYRYDNQGNGWTPFNIQSGMRIYCFLDLPKGYGRLAGTSKGLYWQSPKSDGWKQLTGPISKQTVYSLELDPANPVVYAGTDQGIYRSSLAAMDFQLPKGYALKATIWCILAPPSAPGLVYAGTSLGFARSLDSGITWNVISEQGLPARLTIQSVAISPSDKEHLFAGTATGLLESPDGGVRWNRSEDGKMGVSVSAIVFLDDSGDRMLAADKASGGVFYSQDGGRNWEKFFSDEFASPVYCIARLPQKPFQVFLGTRADGVYRLTLPSNSFGTSP